MSIFITSPPSERERERVGGGGGVEQTDSIKKPTRKTEGGT